MIYDLRYHLFTIGAIFAALGIGILIGTTLPGDELLQKEQLKLIGKIESEITEQKIKNNELNSEIKFLKNEIKKKNELQLKFMQDILPYFSLNNKYLIITDRNTHPEVEELKELMNLLADDIDIINSLSDNAEIRKAELIWWPGDKEKDKLNKNLKQSGAVKCPANDKIEFIMWLMGRENERDKISINNNASL